jgi:predicted nucleotidyltransferase
MSILTAKTRASRTVSRARIGQVVEQIVEKFTPAKVILFGSYATGQATETSDVDLLVVMDQKVATDASLRIRRSIRYDFGLDLLVMQQSRLESRVAEGDFFLQDILKSGKVLFEKTHS